MISSFAVSHKNSYPKAADLSDGSRICLAKTEFMSISGIVISGNGIPLGHASILSPDHDQVTSTSLTGQFSITAPVNGLLEVSCQGHKTMTVTINHSSFLLIMLQPDGL
ncbi:carboxypeptidase-like regulatory domain-containing protein [Fulvivirga sediminis]|uniref:Uncharacterized protein n=1 Tax=Fulvivirga sediminis TaxID=2803949 RepID=A0A937JXW1_9BACT|nr:carboxypeptidase-like regulatory domain-containing protein [Fulvivirga sediminis]MBL3655853.1 hypothetical protein [Fulvivirga sediminis]